MRSGRRSRGRATGEGAGGVAVHPAVGGHVARAVDAGPTGEVDRGGEVVDVEELGGRVVVRDRERGARRSARASQPLPSGARVTVGRSTATVAPGWSSRQSAADRSSSAFSEANPTPGFGRSGASSVSGTRVVGPRAVGGRARQEHQVGDAHRRRRVEHAVGEAGVAGRTTTPPAPGPVVPWARCTTTSAPSNRGFRSAEARSATTASTASSARIGRWSMATTRDTSGSAAASAQTRRPSGPAAPVTTTTPRSELDAIALRCPNERLWSTRQPVRGHALPGGPREDAGPAGRDGLGQRSPARCEHRHRGHERVQRGPRRPHRGGAAGPRGGPPRRRRHRPVHLGGRAHRHAWCR